MDDYRQEEYEEKLIEEYRRELAEGPAHGYLATYGDAVETRVLECIDEAVKLYAAGFPGAALARSVTGIEILIRHFLVQPLIFGAFSTDEWADLLVSRILKTGPRASTSDRELLPAILRNWGIDITRIVLPSGSYLWQSLTASPRGLIDLRNRYLHQGDSCDLIAANLGIECAAAMMSEIVMPLAARLGLTRNETNCWHVVLSKYDRNLNPPSICEKRSPFRE